MMDLSLRHRLPDFSLEVAFEAAAGVTAIFGRSGAGKTTLINAIAGLLRPDEGHIRLNGRSLLDTSAKICLSPAQRRIGYVFQEARLFPHMKVKTNLLYGWHFSGGRGAAPSFAATVELLGIGHLLERRPYALSGGEKQRVAIGRALLAQPQLLLMDEPLAALDEARKAELLPYLERLCRESTLPVLYVSHSLAEITRLAQRIVLLDRGKSIAAGSVGALLSRPDLAPYLGLKALGSVLPARVRASSEGITALDTPAGEILVAAEGHLPGEARQIRIEAQDVLLALEPPSGLSALNILPAEIESLSPDAEGGVLVRLKVGEAILLSRITARSAQNLALAPNKSVYAVLKSAALSLAQS